jgi:hypothetical protein
MFCIINLKTSAKLSFSKEGGGWRSYRKEFLYKGSLRGPKALGGEKKERQTRKLDLISHCLVSALCATLRESHAIQERR